MNQFIRVAILEDSPLVIEGYQRRLSTAENILIAGTYLWSEALEPGLDQNPADILLMDISVPTTPENTENFSILPLLAHLREKYPDLQILIASMQNQPYLSRKLFEAGIRGYILKDDLTAMRNLAHILYSVCQNHEMYISRQLA